MPDPPILSEKLCVGHFINTIVLIYFNFINIIVSYCSEETLLKSLSVHNGRWWGCFLNNLKDQYSYHIDLFTTCYRMKDFTIHSSSNSVMEHLPSMKSWWSFTKLINREMRKPNSKVIWKVTKKILTFFNSLNWVLWNALKCINYHIQFINNGMNGWTACAKLRIEISSFILLYS